MADKEMISIDEQGGRGSGPEVPAGASGATLRLHLWFESEEGMLFGLGRVQLLQLVRDLGSLNKAAKALGMSYRAAWGRIRNTEERLGFPLVVKSGGRKGFTLTPEAEELLEAFRDWYDGVEAFALERTDQLALERAAKTFPWAVGKFEAPDPALPDDAD